MNTGYDPPAVVLGPQRLDTMPRDMYADSGNLCQQEQSMLHEHAQTHNATEHSSGANGITDPMTLDTKDASWVLYWQPEGDGTLAHARVRVKDQIRDSKTFLWPLNLPLLIHAAEIRTLNLQGWIWESHAPVSRVKCVPGTDNRNFDDLVKLLRNCGGYATASWKAGGSSQARLLLTPLGTDLLCVAFPVEGIPKLPTFQSPGSGRKRSAIPTRSRPARANNHMAMSSSLDVHIPQRLSQSQEEPPSSDIIEQPHVDFDLLLQWVQKSAFASVDPASPPHAQPEQQSDSQQSQQVAAMNMLGLGNQLDDRQMDPGATSSGCFYPSSAPPWQGDSSTYLGISESTTGYTNTDMMEFDPALDYVNAFKSSAGTGSDFYDD